MFGCEQLVHHDVKPANVFIDENELPMISFWCSVVSCILFGVQDCIFTRPNSLGGAELLTRGLVLIRF